MTRTLFVCSVGSTALALGALSGLRNLADHEATTPGRQPTAAPAAAPVTTPTREASASNPASSEPARVIQLEELRVVGRKTRGAISKSPSRSAVKLVPCSGWRALGPVYSAPAGTVPRQRSVQMLCRAP